MVRRFLQNFFVGRNGYDSLARLTTVLSFIFIILSYFVRGIAGMVIWVLMIASVVYTYFRVLSRNIYKRAEENNRYLQRTMGIRNYFRGVKMRFSQRKYYKFFKCPTCHSVLRVPKGKGKIQITCRKCGNRFSGKT